jgi:hypothetical protein
MEAMSCIASWTYRESGMNNAFDRKARIQCHKAATRHGPLWVYSVEELAAFGAFREPD